MPKNFLPLVVFPFLGALVLTAGVSSAQCPAPDSLYNPFTLEQSGLPYVPLLCGVGLPERLDEKKIGEAAQAAFARAGIPLKPGYLWRGPAGALYLDGYDSVSHFGYVFLDMYELGPGTEQAYPVRYGGQPDARSPLEIELSLEKARLFRIEDKKWAHRRLLELSADTPPRRRAEYEALVEAVERGDSTLVDQRVIENFYLATHYLGGMDVPGPLRAFVQRVINETGGGQRRALLRRLYLLSEYRLLFFCPAHGQWRPLLDRLSARSIELSNQKPGRKRQVRLEMLRTVVQMLPVANYEAEWKSFLPAIQAALEAPDAAFWDEIDRVSTELEYRRASMAELENIHRDAQKARAFIVVLSHLDGHTYLRSGTWDLPSPPDSIRGDWKRLAEWERRRSENRRALDREFSQQCLEEEIIWFVRWAKSDRK